MDSYSNAPRRGATRLGAAGYRSASDSILVSDLSPYRSVDPVKPSPGRGYSNTHETGKLLFVRSGAKG
jgi:hypothetical protein